MTSSLASAGIENLTVTITQEIQVQASLEVTFASLLEQLGPENETPEQRMPMKLEAWRGGRWFRDLGNGDGHFWGHVQALERPRPLDSAGAQLLADLEANYAEDGLRVVRGVSHLDL